MKAENKTKAQLIAELRELRQKMDQHHARKAIRRQRVRALQETDDKYRTLTENSLTGIFIHQDGKFVFVNKRFADIQGYQPDELIGKDHLSLIHPDQRRMVKNRTSKRPLFMTNL